MTDPVEEKGELRKRHGHVRAVEKLRRTLMAVQAGGLRKWDEKDRRVSVVV